MNIDPTKYIALGYRLTRQISETYSIDGDSYCEDAKMMRVWYPDSWAIEWCGDEKFAANAELLGVTKNEEANIRNYATENFEKKFRCWNNIYTLEYAKEIKSELFSHRNDIEIIGFGLHESLLDEFIKYENIAEDGVDYFPGRVGSDEQPHNLPHRLQEILMKDKKPLAADHTRILGHEICFLDPIGEEFSTPHLDHKSLSNNITKAGLIESFEEAESIAQDNDKLKIEYNLWPILLVKY